MENYKERREEVEHIADSYGLEAQMRKTVKELSELIQTMSPWLQLNFQKPKTT